MLNSLRNFVLFFSIALVLSSCFRPGKPFSSATAPASPDYNDDKNWAALPTKVDSADAIPFNLNERNNQAEAKVDVFYIHPTVDFSRKGWNADLENEKINKRVDSYPVRMQASAFNGSCKVYAPRYRQATLYSFVEKKTNSGEQALDLAYSDVKRAFDYYMTNFNHGRPFIIASHSQGSRHAFRLLKERIDNDPEVLKKFVCAYAIGFTTDLDYKNIYPCDSSTQTKCVISWCTYKWGKAPGNKLIGMNKFCTNPLSWNRDTISMSSLNNDGGLGRSFKIYDHTCDAKVNDGVLWIHKPKKGRFFHVGKNYHVSDYNLFYMNIRHNVDQRINSYFKNQD